MRLLSLTIFAPSQAEYRVVFALLQLDEDLNISHFWLRCLFASE